MFSLYEDIIVEINRNEEYEFGGYEIIHFIKLFSGYSCMFLLENKIDGIPDDFDNKNEFRFVSDTKLTDKETFTSKLISYFYDIRTTVTTKEILKNINDEKLMIPLFFEEIANMKQALDLGENRATSYLLDDNDLLIAGFVGGRIRAWIKEGTRIIDLKSGIPIQCITIFGNAIVSGHNGIIKYWSPTGRLVHTIKAHNGPRIHSLLVINKLLYSCGSDNDIKAWDKYGNCVHIIQGHTRDVFCLIRFKDMLVSGSNDNTIKCWSLSSYECIKTLKGHTYTVSCLAVYCDDYLLSGSSDADIRVWDVDTGNTIKKFQHRFAVRSILAVDMFIFSSDSTSIYIWSYGNEISKKIEIPGITFLVMHDNHIYGGGPNNTLIIKWAFLYLKMREQILNIYYAVGDNQLMPPDKIKAVVESVFSSMPENILTHSLISDICDHAFNVPTLTKTNFLASFFNRNSQHRINRD